MQDKKSLFADHLRILEIQDSHVPLTSAQHQEKQKIEDLQLPTLRFSEAKEKRSLWNLTWLSSKPLTLSFGLACSILIAVLVVKPNQDTFIAKGAMKVTLYWERAGTVHPLTAESVLQNGDKIGGHVISSTPAVAYWLVTDESQKIISEASEIYASKIDLAPGQPTPFKSGFVLEEPNQGEFLVVIVCPKNHEMALTKEMSAVLNKELLYKLGERGQAEASDCVFVGHRLRGVKKP